jgi:hypothetical protein
MRKRLITPTSANVEAQREGSLDLEQAATVELPHPERCSLLQMDVTVICA